MAQIISAQSKFTGGPAGKRDRFLFQAQDLLRRAQGCAAEAKWDEALEYAYQAGLRTAGARVAVSAVAKRRRLPSSAWERLALVSATDKEWAKEFKAYSRPRSRVATGLDDMPDEALVWSLLDLVACFIDATEAEIGFGSLVA